MNNEKIFDLLILEDGCNWQLPYSILIQEKSKNFIKKLNKLEIFEKLWMNIIHIWKLDVLNNLMD